MVKKIDTRINTIRNFSPIGIHGITRKSKDTGRDRFQNALKDQERKDNSDLTRSEAEPYNDYKKRGEDSPRFISKQKKMDLQKRMISIIASVTP